MRNRTLEYWATRMLLVVGLGATACAVLFAWSRGDCFSCDYGNVLGVPSNVLLAAVGIALAVFGLVWMLRIVGGPRDEPPAWRYRRR
jgi:hypothetical protein